MLPVWPAGILLAANVSAESNFAGRTDWKSMFRERLAFYTNRCERDPV
jgi:hypothetical protein